MGGIAGFCAGGGLGVAFLIQTFAKLSTDGMFSHPVHIIGADQTADSRHPPPAAAAHKPEETPLGTAQNPVGIPAGIGFRLRHQSAGGSSVMGGRTIVIIYTN